MSIRLTALSAAALAALAACGSPDPEPVGPISDTAPAASVDRASFDATLQLADYPLNAPQFSDQLWESAGHICSLLDQGHSHTEVGFTVLESSEGFLTADQAGFLVGVASGTRCPEHAP